MRWPLHLLMEMNDFVLEDKLYRVSGGGRLTVTLLLQYIEGQVLIRSTTNYTLRKILLH